MKRVMPWIRRWSVLMYGLGLGAVMWSLDDPRRAGNVAFVAMTVTMWLFLLVYALLARPFSNREGRALMGFVSAVALVCTQSAINVWIPHYPWRLELRAGLLYLVAVAAVWLLWVLAWNLRESRQERKVRE